MSKKVYLPGPEYVRAEYQRRLREALWSKATLDWKLHDYQKEIYKHIRAQEKNPQNVFVLHASRRLGKSFLLCIIAVEDCLAKENRVIKYCASSAKQIREFILPMMSDIFIDCPKRLKPKFFKNALTYTFKNGSTLLLHGLDEGRAEGVRGAKADKVIVDEAGFVDNLSYVVKSILLPMTLTTKGQTILSSNSPLTPSHDFCQIFTPEAQATQSYCKRTIFDNKTLTQEDIDRSAAQMGGYDNTDFRREYLCEFTVDVNLALVPEFDKNKQEVIKTAKLPQFYKPFVTLDLGFNDGTGAVFGYYDFERATIVIQDEYLARGQNSETISKICRLKEISLWGEDNKPLRMADGQPLSISDLSTTHKYNVGKANNQNLEAGINAIRLQVQSHTLEIDPRCTQLIHQMQTGLWDKSRTKFARPAVGNHNDLIAALMYFVRHVPKQNPFPVGYGFDSRNMQQRNRSAFSEQQQVWINLFGPKRWYMSNKNPETYWAGLPADELGGYLSDKVEQYYNFVFRFGILDRWRRCYLAYYGFSESGADTSRLNQVGTNGEQYVLKINQFRSILQNILVLTTAQPPAVAPKATNTDSKSLNQTLLARGVIDYYIKEKKLERYLLEAAEFSLIAGEGFVTELWDPLAGNQIGVNPETQKPFYDGDIKFASYHPIDIIRECNTDTNAAPKWYVIRSFENKYDLAARRPDLADEIIALTKKADYMSRYHYVNYDNNSDDIPVYTFYHEETDALPNGRMFQFLTPDLYMIDSGLPYKHVPVYRMSPGKLHGTPFGFTVAYDLMGIQKALDSLQSVIATNQNNYGIQNIVAERGSEVNAQALGQGLNLIEHNQGTAPPAPLNLVQTPTEIFSQSGYYENQMETLSGINATARGNPEESLKSGTALALVASQAIQFNSGLQRSYNNLTEDTCTGIIEMLQMFAKAPRIAQIAGKSNRAKVKEFVGEDLNLISRVTVESVNPISQTLAGRVQMAQDLLQIPGAIKTPQHYFEVIQTGTLEPLIEHETSQMLYIRSENEELSDGGKCSAVLTDQHLLHIKEHATVLDSIDARRNVQIIQNVTAHINEHIAILKSPDPNVQAILISLGQQSLGQPPAQPAPHPMPAQPQRTGMPAQVSIVSPGANAATQHLDKPKLPNLPPNSPPQLQQAHETLIGNVQNS